ncbi:MAG: hypothetical protein AAGE13_01675 [Pseudomonadota bacterium]
MPTFIVPTTINDNNAEASVFFINQDNSTVIVQQGIVLSATVPSTTVISHFGSNAALFVDGTVVTNQSFGGIAVQGQDGHIAQIGQTGIVSAGLFAFDLLNDDDVTILNQGSVFGGTFAARVGEGSDVTNVGSIHGGVAAVLATESNVTVTNTGTATGGGFVSGNDDANAIAVSNSGTVDVTGTGIALQESQNRIENSGSFRTGRSGVEVEGSANRVVNTGSIDAGRNGLVLDTGLELAGGLTAFGDNRVLNSGSIDAGLSGMIVGGNVNFVVNRGEISAGRVGVSVGVNDDVSNGNNTVINTGQINALDHALEVEGTQITNTGTLTSQTEAVEMAFSSLVNTGFIAGGGGFAAVSGSLSSSLVNRGTIAGNVVFENGSDTVNTSGGVITGNVFLNDGNDRFVGGDGDDRVFGGTENDVLLGRDGNDVLRGGEGIDVLNGGAGDDRIFGDGGNDRLNGGTDNDVLTGGAGIDFFIFSENNGADRITDFTNGQDRLNLAAFEFASAAEVLAITEQRGTAAAIDLSGVGGGEILLLNTDIGVLNAADFLL